MAGFLQTVGRIFRQGIGVLLAGVSGGVLGGGLLGLLGGRTVGYIAAAVCGSIAALLMLSVYRGPRGGHQWLGFKPNEWRLGSGIILVLCLYQVMFLGLGTGSMLISLADSQQILVFPTKETDYLATILAHSIAAVIFGTATFTPPEKLIQVDKWLGIRFARHTILFGFAGYLVLAVGIVFFFVLSISAPRYQTYLDLPVNGILRNYPHPLLWGITQQAVPFEQIAGVESHYAFDYSGGQVVLRLDSVVLVTKGNETLEVGRRTRSFGDQDLERLRTQISRIFSAPLLPSVLPTR